MPVHLELAKRSRSSAVQASGTYRARARRHDGDRSLELFTWACLPIGQPFLFAIVRRMTRRPKLLAIVGPTASGKSGIAVWLAKKIGGEVISCDSRQVYKGLNIGTGKITRKEMGGVPHHLIDITSPKRQFSVAEFQKRARATIQKIFKKRNIPILCGGTGFYISAVADGIILPEVPPNKSLRERLETFDDRQLFLQLKKLDPRRAKTIDRNNRRRLIRAIEIAEALGKVPMLSKKTSAYDVLYIGLLPKNLRARIRRRLLRRIKLGMISEAKLLHKNGLSYARMNELGLEYRYLADYLAGRLTKKELVGKLETEIWRYAKRQMTWFKRDQGILWFKPEEKYKIEKLTRKFLF